VQSLVVQQGSKKQPLTQWSMTKLLSIIIIIEQLEYNNARLVIVDLIAAYPELPFKTIKSGSMDLDCTKSCSSIQHTQPSHNSFISKRNSLEIES
jgi:hypothetical protein